MYLKQQLFHFLEKVTFSYPSHIKLFQHLPFVINPKTAHHRKTLRTLSTFKFVATEYQNVDFLTFFIL